MIIKCKMCGGDIRFNPGDTYGQCDHCGSESAVPRTNDEQKVNRYNRANHYRRQGEYDKAVSTYERILEEDDTDAEAHWGAVISRYGIEYVEDPATKKQVPTCHRVRLESILADEDYLAAVENAPDAASRELYRSQANEIAELQKEILAISAAEEPYDIFLCYKETDGEGRRTRDSVLAQEIYYSLTERNYKVFFSRITLEDKLGREYEPYIYAALNSARVMLVIGTRPEYFQAAWVKNEWSRYLRLAREDRKKLLIPCYRDMDPYDLPDELENLQSQDMGKIGFMQDLIRGIRKTFSADREELPSGAPAAQALSGTVNPDALVERAYFSLEDGAYDKADELCEAALNLDARNVRAYLGKLLAGLKVSQVEALADRAEPFDTHPQYRMVLRFGDEKLAAQLEKYNQTIRDRMERTGKAKAAAAEILKKYKEVASVYCLAEITWETEEEALRKTEKVIAARQKIIAGAKNELSHLGNLFTGKRRRDLELTISQSTEKVDCLLKENKQRETVIGNAKKMGADKPDYQKMICETAEVYEHYGLYDRAAEQYIKILGYGDVAERIRGRDELKKEIDALMPDRERLFQAAEDEAKAMIGAAAREAKAAIDCKKHDDRIRQFSSVGRTVLFGSYIQAEDSESEPVEWIVVRKTGDYAELVSRDGLEAKPYYPVQAAGVSWGASYARKWLNEDFYQAAFSDTEREAIEVTEVDFEAGGKRTVANDRVFLLNEQEAQNLLSSSRRVCRATQVARANGAATGKDGEGMWWLRSKGKNGLNASCIHMDGKCRELPMTDSRVLLRPAVWINLKKLLP